MNLNSIVPPAPLKDSKSSPRSPRTLKLPDLNRAWYSYGEGLHPLAKGYRSVVQADSGSLKPVSDFRESSRQGGRSGKSMAQRESAGNAGQASTGHNERLLPSARPADMMNKTFSSSGSRSVRHSGGPTSPTRAQQQCKLVLNSGSNAGKLTLRERAAWFLAPPLDSIWFALPDADRPEPEDILRKAMDNARAQSISHITARSMENMRWAMAELLLGTQALNDFLEKHDIAPTTSDTGDKLATSARAINSNEATTSRVSFSTDEPGANSSPLTSPSSHFLKLTSYKRASSAKDAPRKSLAARGSFQKESAARASFAVPAGRSSVSLGAAQTARGSFGKQASAVRSSLSLEASPAARSSFFGELEGREAQEIEDVFAADQFLAGDDKYSIRRLAAAVLFKSASSNVDGRGVGRESLPVLVQLRSTQKLCLHGQHGLIDVEPLGSGPPDLAELDLADCPNLVDVQALCKCTNLRVLSLAKCSKLDLSSVKPTWPRLRSLSLSGVPAKDLNCLSELQNLTFLSLRSCPLLEDVSGLSSMKGLEILAMANCVSLKSVDPLLQLPKLWWCNTLQCTSLPHASIGSLWRAVDSRYFTSAFVHWPSHAIAMDWLEEQGLGLFEERRMRASGMRAAMRFLEVAKIMTATDLEEALRNAIEWNVPAKRRQVAERTLAEMKGKSESLSLSPHVHPPHWEQFWKMKGYDIEAMQALFMYLDKEQKGFVAQEDFVELDTFGGPAPLKTLVSFRKSVIKAYGSIGAAYADLEKVPGDEIAAAAPAAAPAASKQLAKNKKGSVVENKKDSIVETITEKVPGDEKPVTIKFDRFAEWANDKLEWDELQTPESSVLLYEIFVALDSECRNGDISKNEFSTINLFHSVQTTYSLGELCNWLMQKHGTLEKTFKAIDVNDSGLVSSDEIEHAFKSWEHGDVDMAMMAFGFLDVDRSGTITLGEFEAMRRFNAEFFFMELQKLLKWMMETFGSYHWAFDAMKDAGGKGKLHVLIGGNGQEAESNLDVTEFSTALQKFKYPPVADSSGWQASCGVRDPAKCIFNFFDYDRSGLLSREEFCSMLQSFNMFAARDGVNDAKNLVDKEFGGFAKAFDAIQQWRKTLNEEHDAALQREAAQITKDALDTLQKKINSTLVHKCCLCGVPT